MILLVILPFVAAAGLVAYTLTRGNFMRPADHAAGTGSWLTEEHWCAEGRTVEPQGGYEQWLTFGLGYAAVVVAGGSPAGEHSYTVFLDVPSAPEWPSAVWADTNGNGRFEEADGPLRYAVICPSGLDEELSQP